MRDYSENIEKKYLESNKAPKQERKRVSKKDRSKFKKTDFAKLAHSQEETRKRKIENKHLLRGRVFSIFPECILVHCEEKSFSCTVKGALKKEFGRVKNLVVVGDFVLFDQETGSIHYIEPRSCVLSKKSPFHGAKEQLIASNVDQVLISVSFRAPTLQLPLIDRYIIATHKSNMAPVLLINKIDLIEGVEEKAFLEQVVAIYSSQGIPVVSMSATTGEGMEKLKEIMKEKVSVFVGESGVGKTSLINRVCDSALAIKNVTEKTKRGTHTTTRASLLPLSFGGWCVDTPGIQKFGIWDLKIEDLENYFCDITEIGANCKFPNCSHTHEPYCAVKVAVMEKTIAQIRFDSYLALCKEIAAAS